MSSHLHWVGLRVLTGAVVVAAMLSCLACQPPRAAEGGFESADPASKIYAIQRAGEMRDAGAVPQLIAQLDSDDPAVRMYAIIALGKITGERKGYSPYDPPHQRMAAVDRWAEAYANDPNDLPLGEAAP